MLCLNKEIVEVNANETQFEIIVNGHRRALLDKAAKKVYRTEPEFFNMANYKYELSVWSNIEYFCYVDGYFMGGEPGSRRKVYRKGLGLMDLSGDTYFCCEISLDNYVELGPVVKEFIGDIPILDKVISNKEVKLGNLDLKEYGFSTAFGFIGSVVVLTSVLALIFWAYLKFFTPMYD